MLISPVEQEPLTLLTVHLRRLYWGSKAESIQNPDQLKTFATGIDQRCVTCENLLIHHLHSILGLHYFSHLGKILNTEKKEKSQREYPSGVFFPSDAAEQRICSQNASDPLRLAMQRGY